MDIHSHTDHLLLTDPLASSKLLQGVTCEVGGNCGISAAPLGREHRAGLAEELAPAQQAVDWEEMEGFLARLERAGIGPNFATLVGHGNLRGRVVGYGDGKATPEEIAEMSAQAGRALRQGAFGVSAGLIYPPGCYADREELAGVVAAAQGCGFFAVHIRDEGAGLLAAVEEVLEVARRSKVALQLSHHKVTGRQNWGLVVKSVELIEEARREGLDVTADLYPYTATNTSLSAVLPDWMKAGGREEMLARLQEAAVLERLTQEWGARAKEAARWEEYVISRSFNVENKNSEGKKISELCRRSGRPPLTEIVALLLADGGRTEMMRFGMCEADIEFVLRQPWVMVGSDAGAKDFSADWGCPHPRAYGTFPRLLGEYVRKRRLLSLAEGVRKLTALPARRLGLMDRGVLAVGAKADLVIFDPEAIADQATYQEPIQPPQGIAWVLVNGTIAVRQGELTGARPGKVLKNSPRRE